MLFFQIQHGLFQHGHLFRLPDIILITEETVIRIRLADQREEIAGGSQMLSLL